MEGLAVLLIMIAAGMAIYTYRQRVEKKKIADYQLPAEAETILGLYVDFYKKLDATQKALFRERVRDFLARTRITGVKDTIVEDIDRVLIAAGAIIPIFAFAGWRYNNVDEVLVYATTFSQSFETMGEDRNILGMVGYGPLNGKVLLSQQAVRRGFLYPADGRNTVLHEFSHLLDKADGGIDGVPEYLLGKEHIAPWIQYMRAEIERLRKEDTGINPYAATNEAEFFAVMSEYFFEKPAELQQHHPELYTMLARIFVPQQRKN